MVENKEERSRALMTIDLIKATDEELRHLKAISDDDLLRQSRTMDLFAVVESTRRLREALHKEEVDIKWLTFALLLFTVTLVALGFLALRR